MKGVLTYSVALVCSLAFAIMTAAATPGCATLGHPPPNLSTQATQAWYGKRIIKDLDIPRDLAIDAGDAQVLPVDTVRKIVNWHEDAIATVHDGKDGWQSAVKTGVTRLKNELSPQERAVVGNYLDAVVAGIDTFFPRK
jgi:hypothetical protein